MDQADLCTENELDTMTRVGFRSALGLMQILHEYLGGRFQKI